MSLGLSTRSETTRIVHDKRPHQIWDPITSFRQLVAGPFCFQGAWENWKTIEGNWGLLEENTLGFRKLGARKRFLGG